MPSYSRFKKYSWSVLAGLLFCSLIANPAIAVNYVWNGGATGDWADPGNWTPEPPAPPGVPGPGDTIGFESLVFATVTLGENRVVDAVYLDTNDTAFDGGGVFSLTTSTLTNMRASSLTISNAGDNLIVTTGLYLQGNRLLLSGPGESTVQGSHTINCGAGGYLNLNNNVRLNLNGNQTIRLITGTGNWGTGTEISLSNSATLTLTNDTGLPNLWGNYNGVISGNGNLALAFSNRYSLTGSNTYNGWTRVISGDLELIGSRNILPNTTTLQVDGGAECSPAEQTLAGISGAGIIEIWSDETLTVNQAGNSTFSGNIDKIGNDEILEKTGTGSLTLSGTVEPEVHVQNGTLVINGTARRIVEVNGGTLLGTGRSVGRLRLNGGTLSPGSGIGTFTASGGFQMGAGTTLAIEVSGLSADQINVTGAVDLGGATLTVTGAPSLGATFTIVNNDGGDAVTNTFRGLVDGDTLTSGGYVYEIRYVGGTGNEVTLTATAATIPTLNQWGLVILSLFMIGVGSTATRRTR